VLPLGPPDSFGSPYASPSAFAGWDGILAEPDAPVSADETERFVATHPYWIADWAAFAGPGALAGQVRFEREWSELRAYAAKRGVRLIGDVPIYVAAGGADQAAHPALFESGEVAAAPPDPLNEVGQLWGNPLYDWHAMRLEGYRWWTERFRRVFELVDVTRIDHFRGFVAFWAVPEGAASAKKGRWRPGPGADLFHAVEAELGRLPLIAEDLGVITQPVYDLRDELGLPGMVVMHWAFGGDGDNPHRLENHRERLVVYTATHDTDTTVGWYRNLPARERALTSLDRDEPQWSLIELAYSSPAQLAILPVQDVLGLGSEARMNRPGEAFGNWSWRLEPGQLTDELAARLHGLAESSGRT
jgi:4-alpha-glucanotransferase